MELEAWQRFMAPDATPRDRAVWEALTDDVRASWATGSLHATPLTAAEQAQCLLNVTVRACAHIAAQQSDPIATR